MTRRPVKAINSAGLTPAPITSARPDYRWVDPCSLVVDEDYQREISARSVTLIRRIVAEWDWALFAPPVVADVDGVLEVIDGQHRAIAAATHPLITEIPVQVVDAAALADRAKAFVGLNMNRLAMTSQQIFFARLNGGDALARKVSKAAADASVRILKAAPSHAIFKPGDTMAIGYLQSLARKGDDDLLRRVLRLCGKGKLAPISLNWLRATELCIRRRIAKDDDIVLLMTTRGREMDIKARTRAAEQGIKGYDALATMIAEACRGR